MPSAICGYEAWLEVNGKRLEEFPVPNARCLKKYPERYVPCETGQEFTIVCVFPVAAVKKTIHHIEVDLDGWLIKVVDNHIIQKDEDAQEPVIVKLSAQVVNAGTVARNFKFGKLELTDDDEYLEKETKDFGEIGIRVKYDCVLAKGMPQTLHPPTPDGFSVHETVKNGRTHCVKLSEEQRPYHDDAEMFDIAEHQTRCVFVWRYRHREILEAKKIAPKRPVNRRPAYAIASRAHNASPPQSAQGPPTPVKRESPSPDLSEDEDDDDAALRAELARRKAQVAELEERLSRRRPAPPGGSNQATKRTRAS